MLASSFQFQYIARAVKMTNHDPTKLNENTANRVVHTINKGYNNICVHVGLTIYMLWSTGAQLSSKLLGNWSVVYMHREFLHYNNFMCKFYGLTFSIYQYAVAIVAVKFHIMSCSRKL